MSQVMVRDSYVLGLPQPPHAKVDGDHCCQQAGKEESCRRCKVVGDNCCQGQHLRTKYQPLLLAISAIAIMYTTSDCAVKAGEQDDNDALVEGTPAGAASVGQG